MLRLDVRPEAEVDVLQAASWYDREREGLGSEFVNELRASFARIEAGPLRFPLVLGDFRRAIVHRFPFGVFFVVEEDRTTVLAVMHLHRDPRTWQKRG
jgi:plasmid stabilization system protein ParE